MTTNHITRLDDALIHPGRADMHVELGLVDKKMTTDLFCVVFKPMEGDVALPENARLGDNKKVHEAARIRAEEAKRVDGLANKIAAKVLELRFSPAEILSLLTWYRQLPGEAINNVEMWMMRICEQRRQSRLLSVNLSQT